MTKLNQINICYLPNDLSLKLPGDRRRFVFFARYMKISYETKMQDNYYQLIYCTYGNNLSKIFEFIKKHPKTKLIFVSLIFLKKLQKLFYYLYLFFF